MCTSTTLNLLLKETQSELLKVFGNKLLNVVLYGSYARGDYDDESDIDIMALVDMDRDNLNKYRRCVSEMSNIIKSIWFKSANSNLKSSNMICAILLIKTFKSILSVFFLI